MTQAKLRLSTPITELPGIGPSTAERLERIGVSSIEEMFELLPFRCEDRSRVTPIRELQPNTEAVIAGKIERISSRVSKRGVFMLQAKISDETGSIQALWFNQRYLLKNAA